MEKRQKAVAAMNAAKKKLKSSDGDKPKRKKKLGRRIINVDVLVDNLYCCNCKEKLHLENIEDETRSGLLTIYKIKCEKCEIINSVPTDLTHKKSGEQSKDLADSNSSIVLGN